MRRERFQPLGMHSAKPRFDDSGTFIGSSYVLATARDFAPFGNRYLRDGAWETHRILSERWIDLILV
jgi:CubicO group peptidase (beta-lactamase class C family)